ncbi:MAG: hypothetical protein LLG20_23885 [Acidobacteriales bacterium]|nr:hypothetical protein [Terriglobales bacterium]
MESSSPQSIHILLFIEWLSLTLQEQKAELDAYVLIGLYEPTWVVDWLAERYPVLSPPDATEPERQLLLSGFEALIDPLRRQ